MIEVDRTPLPPSGFVRVRTSRRPVAVRLGDTPLAEVARDLDDTRVKTALAQERREAFEEATRTAARALGAAVDLLEDARERAAEALSADAVKLAVEIAQQILKVEIDASNYDLERIVRATLAASGVKRGHCIIHVHPEDAAMLGDVIFREETALQPDIDIPRGTVQVETPKGLLVREPAAALEEIREQLLEDLV